MQYALADLNVVDDGDDGDTRLWRMDPDGLPVFDKFGGSYSLGVHICRVVGSVLVLYGCVSSCFMIPDNAELQVSVLSTFVGRVPRVPYSASIVTVHWRRGRLRRAHLH